MEVHHAVLSCYPRCLSYCLVTSSEENSEELVEFYHAALFRYPPCLAYCLVMIFQENSEETYERQSAKTCGEVQQLQTPPAFLRIGGDFNVFLWDP